MKHKRQVWENYCISNEKHLCVRLCNGERYKDWSFSYWVQDQNQESLSRNLHLDVSMNVCSKAVCLYRSEDRPLRGQRRTQACFFQIRATDGFISAGTWIQILGIVLFRLYQDVLRPVRWSSPTTALHLWESKSRKKTFATTVKKCS